MTNAIAIMLNKLLAWEGNIRKTDPNMRPGESGRPAGSVQSRYWQALSRHHVLIIGVDS